MLARENSGRVGRDSTIRTIDGSEGLTGYRVGMWARGAFQIVGYTSVVPPGAEQKIGEFWDTVIADGRLEKLRAACPTDPWILGLGSWDPECEEGGQRYTICVEETEPMDFCGLSQEHSL